MAQQVLDYSAGFPGAAAIAAVRDAQGQQVYVGAVRYIGFPLNRKCTTAGELADFGAHGLGMALVFERTSTDWRGGYAAGVEAGRLARDHANKIGFSQNRPIYMAVDQDVVSEAEFLVMLDYLRGAQVHVGGAALTGVYGEADVVNRAIAAKVCAWGWQTSAWSRGKRTAAHLFQHVGTVYVGGIGCDINDVLEPDWGQHNRKADDDMNLTDKTTNPHYDPALNDGGLQAYTVEQVMWGTNDKAGQAADIARRVEAKVDAYAAMVAAATHNPDITKDELIQIVDEATPSAAAIAAEIRPGLVDELLSQIGPVLAASVGDATATDVVRQLGEKLTSKGTTS